MSARRREQTDVRVEISWEPDYDRTTEWFKRMIAEARAWKQAQTKSVKPSLTLVRSNEKTDRTVAA